MILDLDYRIVAANAAVQHMTGLTQEQMIGRRCYEIFHGGAVPPQGCPYSIMLGSGRHIAGGLEMDMESLGKTFLVTVTPLHDANGALTGTLNVARDVTEQKRVEAILRRSLRVQRMITHCDQAVVRVEDDEDELLAKICQTMVEQGDYRMAWVGYGLDDAERSVQVRASAGHHDGYLDTVGLTWADSERGRGPTGTAIRTGNPVICRDTGADPKFTPWRDEAQKRGFGSSIALPLPLKEGRGALNLYAGERSAFDAEEVHLLSQLADDLAYGIDVIRGREVHRRTAKSLQESEEKYRTLIAGAHDAIVLIDAETGLVIEANAAAERLLGRTQAEIIGMSRTEFCPGVDRELCHHVLNRRGDDQQMVPEDVYVVRGDGRLVPVQVSASVVTIGGKQVIQGIFRDIGKKRQAEEHLRRAQKMESLGALAGGIAHDFNNILAPILGYSELCLSMVDPHDKLHTFMAEILAASHRAKDLVRQIQAFSRQGEQQNQPLLVQVVVKEALKFLRSSLPATIDLHTDIDAPGGYVLCDPAQIHQVVMALCTNAYQAMVAKGGELTVMLRRVEVGEQLAVLGLSPGAYLCLVVGDTGVGIANHDMPRIFEPYFTTKGPGEGTGMGLAVVDGIVRKCGGVIEVDSQLGHGATFRVYLPEIGDKTAVAEEESALATATGNQRILLADDEAVVVETMAQMLISLGYQVTSARDGQAALELFFGQPDAFALVLTDQTMPRLTGIDLAREIFAFRPDLPVVIFTGYEGLHSEEELAATGIKAFLHKPVGMAELARTLHQILAGQ